MWPAAVLCPHPESLETRENKRKGRKKKERGLRREMGGRKLGLGLGVGMDEDWVALTTASTQPLWFIPLNKGRGDTNIDSPSTPET